MRDALPVDVVVEDDPEEGEDHYQPQPSNWRFSQALFLSLSLMVFWSLLVNFSG